MKSGLVGVLFAALVATSCLDPSEGIQQGLIDPSDPDELSQVLIIPGADRDDGDPPPPSGDPDTPTVSNTQASGSLTAGGEVILTFDFNSSGGGVGVGGVYVQVIGASDFLDVAKDDSTPSGTVRLPVQLPTNVADGFFGLSYCIYDNSDLVSQVIESTLFVTSATCEGAAESCVTCENFCFQLCPETVCPQICETKCPILCQCTSSRRDGGGTVDLMDGFERPCCAEAGLEPNPDESVNGCICEAEVAGPVAVSPNESFFRKFLSPRP